MNSLSVRLQVLVNIQICFMSKQKIYYLLLRSLFLLLSEVYFQLQLYFKLMNLIPFGGRLELERLTAWR